MKNEIKFGTGFADAEILEYRRNRDDSEIIVKTWNDRRIHIRCLDTVGIKEIGIGDICGVFEVEGPSPFLEEVLSQVYEERPTTHPYRQYYFLNLDDQPCLQIIATGIEVEYAEM